MQSYGGSNAGNLVKRIDFGMINYSKWDPATAILDLAQLCPNVQEILAYNPKKEFWVQLEKARRGGLCQRVRRIPALIYYETDIVDYVQTALAYKSTLESVLVRKTAPSNGQQGKVVYMIACREILKQLNEFPHLKRLDLTCYTNNSIFELEPLTDQCQLLIRYQIHPNAATRCCATT